MKSRFVSVSRFKDSWYFRKEVRFAYYSAYVAMVGYVMSWKTLIAGSCFINSRNFESENPWKLVAEKRLSRLEMRRRDSLNTRCG